MPQIAYLSTVTLLPPISHPHTPNNNSHNDNKFNPTIIHSSMKFGAQIPLLNTASIKLYSKNTDLTRNR